MTKLAKIISLFLCIAMVFSVAGAMVISSFAAETPTISVTQESNDGKYLVLKISVSKGYVNALDLKFSMSGLECKKVADLAGKGQGNANPTGSASHYACAATEPIKGDLARVTLEIKNANKYSFSVNATECGVTEDIKYDDFDNIISIGDTVKVTPTVKGNINYEKTPEPSSSSTTSTTKTTKSTTSTTKTTKSTTSTTKSTTSTTKTAPTGTVPTNTLPSSTEVPSSSDVSSSVEDTTPDFSYDYDDGYDYYTPDEDEEKPADSDELLEDEKDPKTIIIIAAVAVVLIAGAVVAFVVINKKKNAE